MTAGAINVPSGPSLTGAAALPILHNAHVIPSNATSPLSVHSVSLKIQKLLHFYSCPILHSVCCSSFHLLEGNHDIVYYPRQSHHLEICSHTSQPVRNPLFIVGCGGRGGSLNTSLISPIAIATPIAASLCCSAVNVDQIALIAADENCYNTVWTPALCIHDTLDMFIFFLPTLFVTHLMLDSYGQPRSLIRYHSTSPMPTSLFYI